MNDQTITTNEFSGSKAKNWFTNFIQEIQLDQLKLETQTAGDGKTKLYKDIIFGDGVESAKIARNITTQVLIKIIILDYLNNLVHRDTNLNKLAVDLSNDKLLVWAGIDTDDEESEMNLTLAEAQTNSKFFEETGIRIDTTIVEEIDDLSIPPHYAEITIIREVETWSILASFTEHKKQAERNLAFRDQLN